MEGDAAHLVEEGLGKLAAGFGDGLGPGDEVQRHGVGYGAVEVEEVGLVGAGGDGEWGGGHWF